MRSTREGASELRARTIPLREGGELEKGDWGDTDQIELPALLTYRTLVLRRSPARSRPPSVYRLVRRGEYYDVCEPEGVIGARDVVVPEAVPDPELAERPEAAPLAGSVEGRPALGRSGAKSSVRAGAKSDVRTHKVHKTANVLDAEYPKAVTKLDKDWSALTAFFDFPAEHWRHLRTTNPIESSFATVKLRTRVTKGAGSKTA